MSHQGAVSEVFPDWLPERSDAPSREIIERPRLLEAIQAEPLSPVVLLAAPAGSGKTALLTQWQDAQRRVGLPEIVVWVTCESGETSPAVFWSVVADAADRAGIPAANDHRPQGGRVVLGDPVDPFEAPRRLVRRLLAASRPVVLVLDDAHLVADPDTLIGVGYVAERTSTWLRLFISARFDPGMHLAKVRLAGQILEVRLPELAMTPDEVHELVVTSELALEPEEVTHMHERTEGWVAGVQLCLMNAAASGDPHHVGHELSSDDSSIATYLMEEVMAELDPGLRTFLLETSIVDVITPSWADQLTGRRDGASVLRTLARRTGFVSAVGDDQGHYRYHCLVAGLLRNELRLTDRTRHDELQAHAAELLLHGNRPAVAIPHAIAAEDWDIAAAAVFAAAVHTVGPGPETDLAPWLDKIPADRLRTDPRLSLVAGGLALLAGEVERGQSMLALADSSLGVIDPAGRHEVPALHAILLALGRRLAHDHHGVLRLLSASGPVREPPAPGGPDVVDTSIRACWFSMRAASLLRVGRLPDAREAATAALQVAGETVRWSAVDALETLALVAIVEGDLRSGRALVDEVLNRLQSGAAMTLGHPTTLQVCQAWIAIDEGRFDAAQQMLHLACENGTDDPDPLDAFIVQAAQARVTLYRDGDARGARDQLASLDATLAPTNWLVGQLVAFITVECSVGLGQYETARSVAEQQLTTPASAAQRDALLAWTGERELLSRVMAHALRSVQADPRLAGEWKRHEELVCTAAAPSPAAAGQLRLRCVLTSALVEFLTGHESSASRQLNLVLDQVAAHGWRLPFYELGDRVLDLLASEQDRINDHPELLAQLLHELQGHAAAPSSSLVAPLSARETEVLQYLPTALDREELCTKLFISKNTLKSHLRSIYRKLGADSRPAAVRKARSLDLI